MDDRARNGIGRGASIAWGISLSALLASATFAAPAHDTAPLLLAQVSIQPVPEQPTEIVDDYWFTATYRDGTIVLDGYVPDEALLTRLSQTLSVDVAGLEQAGGAPDKFGEMVDFGLRLLGQMREGRFAIRANVLSIRGMASNPRAYERASELARTGAPQGAVLALAEIEPAPAETYSWAASKDAEGKISLSGYVPDGDTRSALAGEIDDLASDATAIAAGAPDDFAQTAQKVLDVLDHLPVGRVEFDGKNWHVSGIAENAEQLAAIRQTASDSPLSAAGATFEVAVQGEEPTTKAPEIKAADPYLWSAEKTSQGDIILDGFVPDEAFQRFLISRAGQGVTDHTELAKGAPPSFSDNAMAGFSALAGLDHGTFDFDGQSWSLRGEAPSEAAAETILNTLRFATDTESWNVDVAAKPPGLPVADPYTWSVSKAEGGAITLSGHVPTQQLADYLPSRLDADAGDLSLARGAPEGFARDILAALAALDLLSAGEVAFNGSAWSVSGSLAEGIERQRIEDALGAAQTSAGDWNIELGDAQIVAQPEEAATEPAEKAPQAAADYHFAAIRQPGGTTQLQGMVPAQATRQFFSVLAGNAPADDLAIAENPPENFILDAKAGLQALRNLEQGELNFTDGHWSLVGKANNAQAEASAQAELQAAPSLAQWTVDIQGPPPVEICQQKVAAYAADHPILFNAASAKMTEQSAASVAEIAQYLQACPEAYIYVEGHTDSDGDDKLNLALSVARAEAVVELLVTDGIALERLYAVGYGESQPIADNATAEGKRANRRIVFTIRAEPEP